MKLYRTLYTDDELSMNFKEFSRSVWSGTQADATAARKHLKADGMRQIYTDEVDVPTSKPALLEWLNLHDTPKELK